MSFEKKASYDSCQHCRWGRGGQSALSPARDGQRRKHCPVSAPSKAGHGPCPAAARRDGLSAPRALRSVLCQLAATRVSGCCSSENCLLECDCHDTSLQKHSSVFPHPPISFTLNWEIYVTYKIHIYASSQPPFSYVVNIVKGVRSTEAHDWRSAQHQAFVLPPEGCSPLHTGPWP